MPEVGVLVLVDTNILLRLLSPDDSDHAAVRSVVDALVARGDRLCYLSKIWLSSGAFAPRPADKNGFGLTSEETDSRAKLIESSFLFLPDTEHVHAEWRRLVVRYSVGGVQVYDARIAAAMLVHGVTHLLTLNGRDFARYSSISTVHPRDMIPAGSA